MNSNINISEEDRYFMKLACALASENVDRGGGPFGAVIVKDGEIIATGCKTVTINSAPTSHAEVNALRLACSTNSDFQLKGCVVYSSCEPCPMCLSALCLAGVECIYFGNTAAVAARIDFSDGFIYQEMEKPLLEYDIPCIHIDDCDAIAAFDKWLAKEDKKAY